MLHLKVEIPNYLRKITISEHQKPKYYLYDKGVFSSGKKPLPMSYYKDNMIPPPDVEESGQAISQLKHKYSVGYYVDGKLTGYVTRDVQGRVSGKVYLSQKGYSTTGRLYLIDANTFTRIVANPLTAGKPKEMRINFQDLYAGTIFEHTRSKMVNILKEHMLPYVEKLPVIDAFPVRTLLEIKDTVRNITDRSKSTYGQDWDIDNRGIIYSKCILDLLVTLGKIPGDHRMYVTQAGGAIFTPLPTDSDEDRKLIFHIIEDIRDEVKNSEHYKNYNYVKQSDTSGPTKPW